MIFVILTNECKVIGSCTRLSLQITDCKVRDILIQSTRLNLTKYYCRISKYGNTNSTIYYGLDALLRGEKVARGVDSFRGSYNIVFALLLNVLLT